MKIFPVIVMSLNFIAAAIYIFCGNIGQALYWASAGLLNFSVIFMIGD